MKDQIREFLKKNPSPSDEKFHAWAKAQGFDPEKAEEVAYKMLSSKVRKGEEMKKESFDRFFQGFAGELGEVLKTGATGSAIKAKIEASKGDTGPPGKGLDDPRAEKRQRALQRAEQRVDQMPGGPGKGLKDPRPEAMREILKGVKKGISKKAEVSKEARGLRSVLSRTKTNPKTKDFIAALASKTKRKV